MDPSPPLIAAAGAMILVAPAAAWRLGLRVGARRASAAASSGATASRVLGREALDAVLTAELGRADAIGGTLAVLILDVDGLASINDRHGFLAGDRVIACVEQAIIHVARAIDTPARLLGGAYALVTPDRDERSMQRLAADLRTAFERATSSAARELGVDLTGSSISIGAALAPTHGRSPSDLLQAADQAVIAARHRGTGQLAIHGPQVIAQMRDVASSGRASRDAQLATVLSLAEALDLRDADTATHSQTVGRFAELMAIELGFSPAHVERVRVAGVLHDIGKIGVPDSVLRKPAKLTDEEFDMMKSHPKIGARVLAALDIEDIRLWVLCHHERPDGRGYPNGLAGDDIPIEARILSAADAYEAMTADRCYRKAPGPEFARSELEKWRGAQFDDDVVDAFLRVLDAIESVDGPVRGPDPAAAPIAAHAVQFPPQLEDAA